MTQRDKGSLKLQEVLRDTQELINQALGDEGGIGYRADQLDMATIARTDNPREAVLKYMKDKDFSQEAIKKYLEDMEAVVKSVEAVLSIEPDGQISVPNKEGEKWPHIKRVTHIEKSFEEVKKEITDLVNADSSS